VRNKFLTQEKLKKYINLKYPLYYDIHNRRQVFCLHQHGSPCDGLEKKKQKDNLGIAV